VALTEQDFLLRFGPPHLRSLISKTDPGKVRGTTRHRLFNP
jgi:hypothetical protein